MKKLLLGSILLFNIMALGQLPASNALSAKPLHHKKLDQKAIKKCADFLVSKKIIRNVHGYLHRSVGPSKKLLRGVFAHCDFHKYQLRELKEYIRELRVLVDASIPIAARMVFLSLSHPQLEEFVCALDKNDDEDARQPFFEYVDTLEDYLAEQDPEMYISLIEQQVKWQQFNDKWQERMTLLADYVSTRLKTSQKYIERSVESFKRDMIWAHLGPTLGLGIQAAWTARNLIGYHNGDDILLALIQEMYVQSIDKKEMLEKEIISLARKTTRDYTAMTFEVIDHSLKHVV